MVTANIEIEKLSVVQRLELIERIWNSLPEDVAPEDVPEWHVDILKDRLAKSESNPGVGRPWREFMAELDQNP